VIFEKLIKEYEGNLEINENADYSGFKNVVAALDEKGLKLILLFDEFEIITKNRKFDTEFYSFARSIANNFNVAYVVSSGRNLQTLCHSREISDSPFFNIFSNLTLGQFSPEETRKLIIDPAKSRGIDLEPFVDEIIEIGGYYPFFVQMACAPFFDQVKTGCKNDKLLLTHIKEEFFDEAKVHFKQIWDICDEDKRDVILTLAAGILLSEQKVFIVKSLIKEGYVRMEKGKPRLFSSIFSEFVIENFGLARGLKKRKRFVFW
jgi:serine/threonine-protein kinase